MKLSHLSHIIHDLEKEGNLESTHKNSFLTQSCGPFPYRMGTRGIMLAGGVGDIPAPLAIYYSVRSRHKPAARDSPRALQQHLMVQV